ncbi:MAG: hypothetical protein PVI84_07005, partial [Syntrophobacterales bacterium]
LLCLTLKVCLWTSKNSANLSGLVQLKRHYEASAAIFSGLGMQYEGLPSAIVVCQFILVLLALCGRIVAA